MNRRGIQGAATHLIAGQKASCFSSPVNSILSRRWCLAVNANEVYRHIVVRLARAGIVGPQLRELLPERNYTEQEAERLAEEVVDYIEARQKTGNSRHGY